jgi:hypothetical protein
VPAQSHDTHNYDRGAADGPGLRHRRGAPSSLRGACRHGTLVGRTMGLVAVTAALFTLSAYLARTTVRIPDALTALAAGTHGKLTLLLGDDR